MSDSDDNVRLKATLAELGWTTTVSTPPSLACEALRTLQANLDRRKAETLATRDEIWKYKNALRDALAIAKAANGMVADSGAIERREKRIAELQKVFDDSQRSG